MEAMQLLSSEQKAAAAAFVRRSAVELRLSKEDIAALAAAINK